MLTRAVDSVNADLEAQDHRRFIKSHTPYDGLPVRDDVTYICVGRDPRDVFLSWDNHWHNMDLAAAFAAREQAVGLDDIAELLAEGPPEKAPSEAERFWDWVDDDRPPSTGLQSLRATLEHLASFWTIREQPNVVMLHYDDLKADLAGEMRRIADHLTIEIPEDRWPDLVAAASFEHMKRNADTVAPDTTNKIWFDNSRFFNRGESGQWYHLVSDDELPRYFARCAEIASPAVVDWAHHQRPA
jgi:hypothetical protein